MSDKVDPVKVKGELQKVGAEIKKGLQENATQLAKYEKLLKNLKTISQKIPD